MDIFISHNHKDKEFVRRLSSDLRTAGFNVWLDEDIVSVGEKWADKITDALESSDVVLVVLSASSSDSKFQSSEIAYALASQRKSPSKRVIPLVLDRKAELPFFLKDVVYGDFSSPEKYKERLEQLISTLSSQQAGDSNVIASDERKLNAIRAEKEYLQSEAKGLELQRNIWSTTVMGAVASVIAGIVTFAVGAAASAKWLFAFLQEWKGFISGLTVGVLASLVAFIVSKQIQRKSSSREVGNGK
jgi:hypothetical protein